MMNFEFLNTIERLKYDMNDPRMTGYFNFEAKKKLLSIMWKCQDALKDSPTFVGEDEWLKEMNES